MRTRLPFRPLFLSGLCVLALAGCDEIADRLTSVDAHSVQFQPSSGNLTPQARAAEADAWRLQVRNVAEQVRQTVSDRNVYGDVDLWDPILEGTDSRVSACNYRNDSARFLAVTPGQGDEIRTASLQAAYLTGRKPGGTDACSLGDRDLRSFNISAARFTAGVPTHSLDELEVIVEPGATPTPWTTLDFATFSATGDPSTGKGAAQFAFLVVEKEPGWQNNFEEVFLVTQGSYFGDLK